MPRRYDLNHIHTLLTKGLLPEQLYILCYDSAHFAPFYQRFSQQAKQSDFIPALIEYADQTWQLEQLLTLMQKRYSKSYAKYQPYFIEFAWPQREFALRDFRRWLVER